MIDKKLYNQRFKAQLDVWKAGIAGMKAEALLSSADAQISLHKKIDALESEVDKGYIKFNEINSANDEAWDALIKGAESAWSSLKTSFHEASLKYKKIKKDNIC